jgi:arylformamidase
MSESGKPRYFDISPEVHAGLGVFPGDTAFRREVAVNFDAGAAYQASSIHTTVHLGAHVDAPNHYDPRGTGIEARSLDLYMGPCQVVSVRIARNARIRPSDLNGAKIAAPRVLFKTESFPDPDRWNSDFAALSAELVEYLFERGVKLVGIDTPSIDPCEDKVLESHQAVSKRDMAILEGVILKDVPDGKYTLVALPLKIRGADASPVRAVLLQGAL